MEALKRIRADLHVLACAGDCAESFAGLAEEAGFVLFPGPREDVLARYCMAIRHFHIDRLIRATGDNPFVFADAAWALNAEASFLKADYAGYGGLPCGAGVESVSAEALLRAGAGAESPFDREHVCPYLYRHDDMFLLHRPLAPVPWRAPALRVTVDTAADFREAQALYEKLSVGGCGEGRYQGRTIIAALSPALEER
jgi:spore coat polysaccharide biosynthesis protein SpsF